jgi:hypothetical protein
MKLLRRLWLFLFPSIWVNGLKFCRVWESTISISDIVELLQGAGYVQGNSNKVIISNSVKNGRFECYVLKLTRNGWQCKRECSFCAVTNAKKVDFGEGVFVLVSDIKTAMLQFQKVRTKRQLTLC